MVEESSNFPTLVSSRGDIHTLHETMLFIRLIHSVVQGMQIAAMPMDPGLATRGLGKNNKISKIMELKEEATSKAAEVLIKFEKQIKEEKLELQEKLNSYDD